MQHINDPPNLTLEMKAKIGQYRHLNQYAQKGQVVFAGSSLMEFFPIAELNLSHGVNTIIYNRGIAGTTTKEYQVAFEDCVLSLEPSRLFINIGSNDIAQTGFTPQILVERYSAMLKQVKQRVSNCEILVMAYYPGNTDVSIDIPGVPAELIAELKRRRTNEAVQAASQAVKEMAEGLGAKFIDVNEGLTDEKGMLRKEFTFDGIHMWANGYKVVWDNLQKYL